MNFNNFLLVGTIYHKAYELYFRVRNRKLASIFRIQSHLTIRERVRIVDLARNRNAILEIGAYIGASATCFAYAIKESGHGRLYCIDTWNNDAMSEGIRDTYAEFLSNTKPYSQFITPVRGFSTDVVAEISDLTESLDLLFIDGDHSYEGVKADWEAYKHFLKPGSVVVFHDWGWAEGVKRVVAEDVMPIVSAYDHLPNMWWGTIGG